MAQADRRLIMMARRSADERIGLLLLELAAADVRSDPAAAAPRVVQTHAELAQAAAMARPHVSVTLGRFRRKGLISYRRHEPIAVDMERLRVYLEHLEAS
jgi:CRP-like cAMP-binding protein